VIIVPQRYRQTDGRTDGRTDRQRDIQLDFHINDSLFFIRMLYKDAY